MKLGIIGAGHIGGTLTRRLTALGHDVSVANSRGPETLGDLAKETGAKAVTVTEAAHGKDLVVVTIPEKNIRDLPPDLFKDVGDNVAVVDTGNYYPQQRDGCIQAPEPLCTPRTLTPRVCGVGWPRQARSAGRNGAPVKPVRLRNASVVLIHESCSSCLKYLGQDEQDLKHVN